MKICVLNGSPKGKCSVTLQTVLYLQKKYKECTFDIVDVGQKIKLYEKDFSEVEKSIIEADCILFAYPVYTFLAPSQLHKFIRLLKNCNIDLSGKFATQITTSKHFYDVTAHQYIEDNCADLNLKVIKGLSSDMDDLLSKKGQQDAINFWDFVVYSIKNNIYELSYKFNNEVYDYIKTFDNVKKEEGYKTIILTDVKETDYNIINMIEDFQALYPYPTKIINLSEYPFSGGCLGCFNCTASGKCIYKDGFDEFLRSEILTADTIVYAFNILDHSMGHVFKCYDDRQFCNGHRFMTMGMPIGYLIHGDYENEHNLQTVIEARAEVGHNYLSGVATDTQSMKMMVSKLVYSLNHRYYLPQNFYGEGGRKIFRDLIYVMRGFMSADHKFYKENGVYNDLPHKQKGRMIFMMIIGTMINNPKIKKKIGHQMNEAILKPFKKVIDESR